MPEQETARVKECFSHPGALEAALGYYRCLTPRPTPGQRVSVTVPAVAIAGTDDIISPKLYERAASRYRDHYQVLKVPGGHFMHREHPEPFLRALRSTLQERLS